VNLALQLDDDVWIGLAERLNIWDIASFHHAKVDAAHG